LLIMFTTSARSCDVSGSASCGTPAGRAALPWHTPRQPHRSPARASATGPTHPSPARASRPARPGPRVPLRPPIRTPRLRGDRLRCPRPTDAPGCLTPQGLVVPRPPARIAAGGGGATGAPTGRPAAAQGARARAPRAPALSSQRPAPSCMANGWPGSCWAPGWRAGPRGIRARISIDTHS
jgi:hypothetical protein